MDALYWLMGYDTNREIEAAPGQIRHREAILKDIKNLSKQSFKPITEKIDKPELVRQQSTEKSNDLEEKKTSTTDQKENDGEDDKLPAWRYTQSGAWTRMNSFKKNPKKLKKKFRSEYPELYK
jgi:predicted Zn-dependent protease